MSEVVQLHSSDGHTVDAYTADPSGEPVAGLVVLQEIYGVNQHIRKVTDHFAASGFFATAPALFDRVQRGVDLRYEGEDMQKARSLMQKLRPESALLDVEAALLYAKQRTGKKVGVVGYCYGGLLVWLSATRLRPDAAVGYYAGGIGNFAAELPGVPTMLHFGKQDTHIPREQVDKVASAHPQVKIFWYDAGHGFNCDMRESYDADSSRLALERTLSFLRQQLGAT